MKWSIKQGVTENFEVVAGHQRQQQTYFCTEVIFQMFKVG